MPRADDQRAVAARPGERVAAHQTTVAVVLAPASLRQLLPAATAWFGLTPREGEVLQLVALGMPAKHMPRQLQLSVFTVNDHLRAIYRKAHVSGREELLGRLT
jgi:DNA-binding CsgD family transcriptional regulator